MQAEIWLHKYHSHSMHCVPTLWFEILTYRGKIRLKVFLGHTIKYLPYVMGTKEIPLATIDDGAENPEFMEHNEIDEIVLSWIKATVSSPIQSVIIHCSTTYEAWTLFEKEYSPIRKSDIQALREQLRV